MKCEGCKQCDECAYCEWCVRCEYCEGLSGARYMICNMKRAEWEKLTPEEK